MSEKLDQIQRLKDSVSKQGNVVRTLKENKSSEIEINQAVRELKGLKKQLEELTIEDKKHEAKFDRTKVEDLLKRRFFYAPSFEIYGGVAGLYDYGPVGAALESNLLNFWRQHFVISDQMMEVRCSQLTPYNVLKSSGHVERFTDYMVKDVKTGDCYRADHLVKNCIEKIISTKTRDNLEKCEKILRELDNYDAPQLDEIIEQFEMKAPATNNDLTKACRFNLMFETSIGPTGLQKGFMRPETAQGIFVNFKRLLEFNNNKLPFSAAQVGCSFRNEISPRSGLLRVREFLMAEIEHFVFPEEKNHVKFHQVEALIVTIYPSNSQLDGSDAYQTTLKDAVEKGIIGNSSLGYFMGKIYQFLTESGVNPSKLRFRQHLPNEMAHYACDCWDAEIHTSYGWIECVGCADRSCYDLKQHSDATKEKLVIRKDLEKPIDIEITRVVLDKKKVGSTFKKDAKIITEYIDNLDKNQILSIEQHFAVSSDSFPLHIENNSFALSKDMIIMFEKKTSKVYVVDVVPNVIEPSFGIGRILYSILEHTFRNREGDECRNWLQIPAHIAPIKCSLIPISKKPEFEEFLNYTISECTKLGISYRKDDHSSSIGRRYARSDEIGIPFAFTIDFDTLEDAKSQKGPTITIRERDSTEQTRVPISEAVVLVDMLIKKTLTWDQCKQMHGLFEGQSNTKL